jgi:hypothetical protein
MDPLFRLEKVFSTVGGIHNYVTRVDVISDRVFRPENRELWTSSELISFTPTGWYSQLRNSS